METKLYYSIQNDGDGPFYLRFFDSLSLAELDQEYMMYGDSDKIGWTSVESDGPIKFCEIVETPDSIIAQLEETLAAYQGLHVYENMYVNMMKEHLARVKQLKECRGD